MKDLFMCLLLNLTKHGKLTEANMYQGETFSNIKVETESGIYEISIIKKEEGKDNA